ncbi:ABC transporter permease [Alphaproteobacteria bacterium]|nr:ABC transporter permease [Alphaproteobacteria bacterium]
MLSVQELMTCLEVGLIYGIAAIGIYLTFRTINFPDLTCDGSFVLGAAVSSVMLKSGQDPYLAMALALIAGGMAGLFTGILNVYLKIEDLLSGIIVAFMMYSVNLRIMGTNPNISFMDDVTIFSGGYSTIKIAVIVAVLVALLGYVLITDFGLGLRSIGQNKRFASVCGINVKVMTIVGLVVSNALIGMCGGLFTQYQGFCDITQGVGTLVIGLASVIIGEKLLKIKSMLLEVLVCVLGSVIYRVFIAFAIHSDSLGLRTQDLNLITGILIIAIMCSRRKNAVSK